MENIEMNGSETTTETAWGGVTASYEDALRFIDNQAKEDPEKVGDNSTVMLVFGLVVPSAKFDARIEMTAFVYGKTPAQVQADLILMKEREESRR